MRNLNWLLLTLAVTQAHPMMADIYYRDIPRRKLVVGYSEDEVDGSWTVFKYCRDFKLVETDIHRGCVASEIQSSDGKAIPLVYKWRLETFEELLKARKETDVVTEKILQDLLENDPAAKSSEVSTKAYFKTSLKEILGIVEQARLQTVKNGKPSGEIKPPVTPPAPKPKPVVKTTQVTVGDFFNDHSSPSALDVSLAISRALKGICGWDKFYTIHDEDCRYISDNNGFTTGLVKSCTVTFSCID